MQNGLRGLSCVPYAGGYALLAIREGGAAANPGYVLRFDPSTANSPVTAEASPAALSTTYWGSGAAGLNAYNGQGIVPVGTSWVFGAGAFNPTNSDQPTWGGNGAAVTTGLWVRKSDASTYLLFPTLGPIGAPVNQGAYAGSQMQAWLNTITPKVPVGPGGVAGIGGWANAANCPTSPMCPVLSSNRSTALSEFPTDDGSYLYMTGVDYGGGSFATGRTMHDTAWVSRAPLDNFGSAFSGAPSPPAVSQVLPTNGVQGTFVTITGTNLAGATGIKFGTASATSVSCLATVCTARSRRWAVERKTSLSQRRPAAPRRSRALALSRWGNRCRRRAITSPMRA